MCSEWGEGNKRLPEKKKKGSAMLKSNCSIRLKTPNHIGWSASRDRPDITPMCMVSWGAADPPFISLSTPEKQGSDKIVFPNHPDSLEISGAHHALQLQLNRKSMTTGVTELEMSDCQPMSTTSLMVTQTSRSNWTRPCCP